MPKRVRFDGKEHVFPDDFTDADISSALRTVPSRESTSETAATARGLAGGAEAKIGPAPASQRLASALGLGDVAASALESSGAGRVVDFIAGIPKGMESTSVGAQNLAQLAMGLPRGLYAPPPAPEPVGPYEAAGKIAEQGAEFMLPGTVFGRVPQAAATSTLLAKLANLGTRSLATGAEFAGVGAVQRGTPENLATDAAIGAAFPPAEALAGLAIRGAKPAVSAVARGVKAVASKAATVSPEAALDVTSAVLSSMTGVPIPLGRIFRTLKYGADAVKALRGTAKAEAEAAIAEATNAVETFGANQAAPEARAALEQAAKRLETAIPATTPSALPPVVEAGRPAGVVAPDTGALTAEDVALERARQLRDQRANDAFAQFRDEETMDPAALRSEVERAMSSPVVEPSRATNLAELATAPPPVASPAAPPAVGGPLKYRVFINGEQVGLAEGATRRAAEQRARVQFGPDARVGYATGSTVDVPPAAPAPAPAPVQTAPATLEGVLQQSIAQAAARRGVAGTAAATPEGRALQGVLAGAIEPGGVTRGGADASARALGGIPERSAGGLADAELTQVQAVLDALPTVSGQRSAAKDAMREAREILIETKVNLADAAERGLDPESIGAMAKAGLERSRAVLGEIAPPVLRGAEVPPVAAPPAAPAPTLAELATGPTSQGPQLTPRTADVATAAPVKSDFIASGERANGTQYTIEMLRGTDPAEATVKMSVLRDLSKRIGDSKSVELLNAEIGRVSRGVDEVRAELSAIDRTIPQNEKRAQLLERELRVIDPIERERQARIEEYIQTVASRPAVTNPSAPPLAELATRPPLVTAEATAPVPTTPPRTLAETALGRPVIAVADDEASVAQALLAKNPDQPHRGVAKQLAEGGESRTFTGGRGGARAPLKPRIETKTVAGEKRYRYVVDSPGRERALRGPWSANYDDAATAFDAHVRDRAGALGGPIGIAPQDLAQLATDPRIGYGLAALALGGSAGKAKASGRPKPKTLDTLAGVR